eukprot:TRINITY_DN29354_c0_g1_i1.p1 TRINITY_DN29354_c0_g1~~TRINITY_DN29354_c0_g1_i1.p1  ORF type:complete len:445 (+),score=64.89 TRINITY_DN29354_c0_g1_i1:40-1374(+)
MAPSASIAAFTASFAVAQVVAIDARQLLPQHELLRYDVNLDESPSVRYAHVITDFLHQRGPQAFLETYEGWHVWLEKALPELFGTPELARASQEEWLATLQATHPDVVAELQTLAAALKGNSSQQPLLELPALATAVSLYPLLNIASKNTTDTKPSACTSTLARQSDGKVLHGRSLDYEPRDPMAKASVVLDFQKKNQTLYRCLHPLQYPSALQWFTCVRPGAFSLSVNARSQGVDTEHNASFHELLRRVARPGAQLLGEVAEKAMQAESYDAALEVLVSSSVVSSNYFILAGASGQGAIITRFGNSSAADVWALGSASDDWSDGQPPWIHVQTNVDHWVSFSSGAYATHRRQHAVDLLSSMGPDVLDREALQSVYLTTSARSGSQNRTTPEDTGVILRPSTIATLIMDPSSPLDLEPDPKYWHVWAETPTIHAPESRIAQLVV